MPALHHASAVTGLVVNAMTSSGASTVAPSSSPPPRNAGGAWIEIRQADRDNAAGRRQDQRLHEREADEPGPTGAERDLVANSVVRVAARAQEEIGETDARREEE